MISHNFSVFPPPAFMKQILDPVSKMYVYLWEKKNLENRVYMSWEDVRKEHHCAHFRATLRKLNDAGLLDYYESDTDVAIELVKWQEELDG